MTGWRGVAAVAGVVTTWGCEAAPLPGAPRTEQLLRPQPESAALGSTGDPAGPPLAAAVLDPAIADRYPSLTHYPAIGAPLQDALLRRAPPVEILAALGEAMVPYRWPSASDWDRAGFIDLDATTPGFVTRTTAKSVSQPTGRHDLGCTGGFLEGVRLVVAPRLSVAELEECAPETFAVIGAPRRCDRDREFGWLALANIAALLPAARLADGQKLFRLDPRDASAHARLAKGGALHLCSVSHEAAARRRQRFHHHMFIALGEPDGLWVFDTTGVRGVAIETMSAERFVRYFTTLLASSREFRYVAKSSRLTCLAVTRDSS